MSDAPVTGGIDARGNRGYPGLVFLPWLFALVAFWIIVAVDPYHLRQDGPAYRFADHLYPDLEWPRLMRLATAQPHDLVLLGGSTVLPISNDMVQQAFPGTRSPINLSYLSPRPFDMPWILPRIEQVTGLERVILVMDFTLLDTSPRRSYTGDVLQSMATTNWSHRGDFGLSTAVASLHAFATGTYDLGLWSKRAVPDFMLGGKPLTESAADMQRFRSAVARHADDVFAKSRLTCSQIPYLQRELVPFLTDMANKHVAVDLVFPSLPYVIYYDWIDRKPPFHDTMLPGPVFDQMIVFKKCVIAARDQVGADNDRVIALDSNASVSGDLGLYFDTIHPLSPETYRTEARMIANGNETISAANIDRHEADLRSKVAQWAAQFEAQ